MRGILMKDLFNLRQYAKIYLLFIAFYGGLSVYQQDIGLFSPMITMIMVMIPISTMSFDAYVKWDRFALSMPITRKEVVAEKYLLVVVMALAGVLIAALFQTIMWVAVPETVDWQASAAAICGTFLAGLFLNAMMLPVAYKAGVEKARYVMIGAAAVFMIGVIGVSKIIPEGAVWMSAISAETALMLAAALCLVFYIGSYFLSVKIYTKKDF